MIKSMTGYARVQSEPAQGIEWTLELHSVNRKHLEIHVHCPKELLFLEQKLRKTVAEKLKRGQIALRISYKRGENKNNTTTLLKQLKSRWESVVEDLGYEKEELTFSLLLDLLKQCSLEELGPECETVLVKALDEALLGLDQMRVEEGKALQQDLKKRLSQLQTHVKTIESLAATRVQTIHQKMKEQVEKLLEKTLAEERLLAEVAIYADKLDISEEITRLTSHTNQFLNHLQSNQSVGKTLEFLLQEMLRETNTIGSKAQNIDITQEVIAIKAELEKIREQVQNIE